jgi:hypothetical protein
MSFIDLDRQFSRWREDQPPTGEAALFEHYFTGEDGWAKLLQRQRVVILAEAGSGKSVELAEQAKRLRRDAKYAFHATVQNVAKEGLTGALGRLDAAKLDEWRKSDQLGWFLIDSVDEAKLDHVRLTDGLAVVATPDVVDAVNFVIKTELLLLRDALRPSDDMDDIPGGRWVMSKRLRCREAVCVRVREPVVYRYQAASL